MHRATPANSSFRAYTGGGTRSAVDTIDDSKLMQEMGGNFMHSENRQAIESPQNYGFTSVVAPATKGSDGSITDSAEAVISFMGSNRSFPVAGVMDDRRHRLRNMKPGDVAMFRQASDKLQMHLNTAGAFLTGPRNKTVRMQLVDEDSGQQQQGQQQSLRPDGTARDVLHVGSHAGTGSSGSSSGSQQQTKGQSPIYENGQKSYRFVHCTGGETACGGSSVRDYLQDGKCYRETTGGNVYLGADHSANQQIVVTVLGPAKNTLAQV
jgi:phage gp45-like